MAHWHITFIGLYYQKDCRPSQLCVCIQFRARSELIWQVPNSSAFTLFVISFIDNSIDNDLQVQDAMLMYIEHNTDKKVLEGR